MLFFHWLSGSLIIRYSLVEWIKNGGVHEEEEDVLGFSGLPDQRAHKVCVNKYPLRFIRYEVNAQLMSVQEFLGLT